ncbi:MAG: ferritin-like domain-containing protein [Candidatus Krumholzibacteriia bacterium]
MSMFSGAKFEKLDDLFWSQINDLYDAEQQLTEALPKMADTAQSPRLKEAFKTHLRETEGQIRRLERIYEMMGEKPNGETCEAMKGLIKEGEEILKAKGDHRVRDAGLIAAAQRTEHYEMAGYGTARHLAQRLGHTEAAELLRQTLDEEKHADKLLNEIAIGDVNEQAERA